MWFPRFRAGISKDGSGHFSRKDCQIVGLINMDTRNKRGKGMRSNALGSADWQEMVGMKRKFYSPWKRCFSFCFPPNLAWTVLSTFLDLVKSTEISAFLQQGQHDLWYCWQTTASHAGQEECSKDLQIKCILLPPDPTAHSGSSQNPQNKSRMWKKKKIIKN